MYVCIAWDDRNVHTIIIEKIGTVFTIIISELLNENV